MNEFESRAHFLIAGDTVDLPAIRETLRRLPVDAFGQVYIEVASAIQIQELSSPQNVIVTWLPRDAVVDASGAVPPRGERIVQAVTGWVEEWMPDDDAGGSLPYLLWIGCTTNDLVDRLYIDLHERVPGLHLHHPHHPSRESQES